MSTDTKLKVRLKNMLTLDNSVMFHIELLSTPDDKFIGEVMEYVWNPDDDPVVVEGSLGLLRHWVDSELEIQMHIENGFISLVSGMTMLRLPCV